MQTWSDSLLTPVYLTVWLDQDDEMRCWSASLLASLTLTVSVNLACKTHSCSTALCAQFIWLSLSTGMAKREASILLFCSRKDSFFLCVKVCCRMLALLLPLHSSNVPLLPRIMHRSDALAVWPMLQVYKRCHPSEQAPLEEDVHPPRQNKKNCWKENQNLASPSECFEMISNYLHVNLHCRWALRCELIHSCMTYVTAHNM